MTFDFYGENIFRAFQDNNGGIIRDRLHTSGQKALYPTFVNLGDKETLDGNADLFILKLKEKRKVKFNLKTVDGILIDKDLNVCKF